MVSQGTALWSCFLCDFYLCGDCHDEHTAEPKAVGSHARVTMASLGKWPPALPTTTKSPPTAKPPKAGGSLARMTMAYLAKWPPVPLTKAKSLPTAKPHPSTEALPDEYPNGYTAKAMPIYVTCHVCNVVMLWSDYSFGSYEEGWGCSNAEPCGGNHVTMGSRWRWFCLGLLHLLPPRGVKTIAQTCVTTGN